MSVRVAHFVQGLNAETCAAERNTSAGTLLEAVLPYLLGVPLCSVDIAHLYAR